VGVGHVAGHNRQNLADVFGFLVDHSLLGNEEQIHCNLGKNVQSNSDAEHTVSHQWGISVVVWEQIVVQPSDVVQGGEHIVTQDDSKTLSQTQESRGFRLVFLVEHGQNPSLTGDLHNRHHEVDNEEGHGERDYLCFVDQGLDSWTQETKYTAEHGSSDDDVRFTSAHLGNEVAIEDGTEQELERIRVEGK